jgi:hypothetical protein
MYNIIAIQTDKNNERVMTSEITSTLNFRSIQYTTQEWNSGYGHSAADFNQCIYVRKNSGLLQKHNNYSREWMKVQPNCSAQSEVFLNIRNAMPNDFT